MLTNLLLQKLKHSIPIDTHLSRNEVPNHILLYVIKFTTLILYEYQYDNKIYY